MNILPPGLKDSIFCSTSISGRDAHQGNILLRGRTLDINFVERPFLYNAKELLQVSHINSIHLKPFDSSFFQSEINCHSFSLCKYLLEISEHEEAGLFDTQSEDLKIFYWALLNEVWNGIEFQISKLESIELETFNSVSNLYIEHGLNCSTFTARVSSSSLPNKTDPIIAALLAFRGDIHGRAVVKTMEMLEKLDGQKIEDFVDKIIQRKQKIMGFGHRIYQKEEDPRYSIALNILTRLEKAQEVNKCWSQRIVELCEIVDKKMGLKPNLDIAVAPIFLNSKINRNLVLPVLIRGRMCGWMAHIIEQMQNNKIVRPSSIYTGPHD